MAMFLLYAAAVQSLLVGTKHLMGNPVFQPCFHRSSRLVLAEPSMPDSGQPNLDRQAVNAKLESDLAAFRAQEAMKEVAPPTEENSILKQAINILGKILTFNFFVICIFFLWFLAGAQIASCHSRNLSDFRKPVSAGVFAQFALQQTAIIGSFQGAWDVIILPLLSTHMALTFLSAGLEKL